MADLGGTFDATTIEPARGMQPIPAGKYRCSIIKSEWKETSKKNGKYLEFTFEVLEGEHKGRRVWARLNLINPSADAVRIAKGELSAICHATGVLKATDTAQMHNIPLFVNVRIVKGKNDKPMNEVDSYESTEEAAKKAAGGAAPEPVAVGVSAEKAPWE